MGTFSTFISDEQQKFIREQTIVFVASAPLDGDGDVNLSPKGLDTSFRFSRRFIGCYSSAVR